MRYTTATGRPTRKVLGDAWVRDSGRRTARGAVIWRAADGPCPEDHLTPKAARAMLDELLAAERGADTPLRKLTDARIERLQSELLISGLSLRTVQKAMVLLHGVLEFAKRRGWMASNPCANLERIRVKRRRDLVVLSPDEVFLVAGAAARTDTPIVKDRREL